MTRRTPNRYRLSAALVAISLLAAACGSDGAEQRADGTPAESSQEGSGSSSGGADAAASTDEDEAGSDTSDDSAAADSADGELRTVQTSFGDVQIPVDPQRIIALDAVAAMNLISVGVEPTTVFDINGAAVVRTVLTDRGIALRSDLGDGFGELNYEAVAAEDPDLIIIVAVEGFESLTGPLAEIAPTIVMPFFGTWREAMRDTGLLFNREAEAEAVIAGLEERFDEVGASVADNPYSLSILAAGLGFVLAMSPDAAISMTAADVGVTRPESQVGDIPPFMGQPAFQVSEELIAEHDADVIAVLSGQFYDDAAVTGIATFDRLEAAQSGNVVVVDGDIWFTGHPFAVFWQLADLEAIALGAAADGVGTVDDSLDRWSDYRSLAGS
ncbi:MAG: ABC transporter substrate-binding protein [Actinomycetota bacterium]